MSYKTIQDWEARVHSIYAGFPEMPLVKEINPREVRGIIDRLPADTWTINGIRLNFNLTGIWPPVTCMTREAANRLLEERGCGFQDMDNQDYQFRAKTVGRYIEIVKADAITGSIVNATTLELPATEEKPKKRNSWLRHLFPSTGLIF